MSLTFYFEFEREITEKTVLDCFEILSCTNSIRMPSKRHIPIVISQMQSIKFSKNRIC